MKGVGAVEIPRETFLPALKAASEEWGRLSRRPHSSFSITNRRKADQQARPRRVCQPVQSPHRRTHSPAFQARDHGLGGPHFSSQLLLGKASAVSCVNDRRCQRKLLLQRVVNLSVRRLFHPSLVHIKYTCHCYNSFIERIAREPVQDRSHAAVFSPSSFTNALTITTRRTPAVTYRARAIPLRPMSLAIRASLACMSSGSPSTSPSTVPLRISTVQPKSHYTKNGMP